MRTERFISVPGKADFFSDQLFGQVLKETLGSDGAFVFANQFGDDLDLSLDLRVKMLDMRTAPGHGPRPLCCSATQEVGSGSNEVGHRRPLTRTAADDLKALGRAVDESGQRAF